MKMRIIIYNITGALLLILSFTRVNAQEVSEKSFYTFYRIEEITPWLTSGNGAGLVYNKTEKNFSTVDAYYKSISGDYRNYNQAKDISNMGLSTSSYTRLKNLFFYGSFNYDYGIRKDQSWLGTTYENAVINPIVDSIPGKNIVELYNLDARVGYQFTDKFAAGVLFRYSAATSAKRIDGRNKNEYSNLVVSPGITFSSKYVNIGLNFNYGHNAEDVSYYYYGEFTNKYLCNMEGLFIYSTDPVNRKDMFKRRYDKNMFGGGVQVELKWDNLSFYNNFTANYVAENDFDDYGFKKKVARINTLEYNYMGILKYTGARMDNSLKVDYRYREDFSYNIINNYEKVPETINSWDYFEYGSVLRYTSFVKNLNVEYKGFIKNNEYLSKIDFTIGYDYNKWDREHKVFPAEYSQSTKNSDFYASVNKNFVCGSNILGINFNGGYLSGSGEPLIQNNPLTTGLLRMNTALLAHEYVYRLSDNYRIGAGVKYSYILNKKRGQTLNVRVDYLYRKVTKIKNEVYALLPSFNAFEKSSRNNINIKLSYNF